MKLFFLKNVARPKGTRDLLIARPTP